MRELRSILEMPLIGEASLGGKGMEDVTDEKQVLLQSSE